jgi:pterin-4a-carbinolamine dehydratase
MKNSITDILTDHGHFLSEDDSNKFYHRHLGNVILEKRLPSELPLKSPQRTWEFLDAPRRISRKFSFEVYTDLQTFVMQILAYQERIHHHGMLKITHDSVEVEIYTHDVDDVTELDIEYSKELDLLYDELGKIARYNKQRDNMNRVVK